MKVQKKRKRSDDNNTGNGTQENKKEDSPNFLLKLYKILETPEYQNIIHWSDNGKYFIVQNLHDFTENILNKYYKHNNYSSFVRQLNMYDFHKKRSSQNEHVFQHKLFSRGNKDLIPTIKRKNRKETHPMSNELAFPDLNEKNNKNNEQALIEYFNNDITKKVTKNSLEKALNYLIKSVNENSEKQKDLEEKVEKLGKQNEDFLLQNQQMLQEIISKTEYNKKLEAVVCFILEMIMKKPSLKSGGDLKNFLISKEINNESNNPPIEGENTQIIPIHDIIQTRLNCKIDKAPLSPKNNPKDPFKTFIDKYVERTSGSNPLLHPNEQRTIPLPMLTSGNADDALSLSLSPIRSRKGSFDIGNNGKLNDEFFKNSAMRQISNNRDLVKKDNNPVIKDELNNTFNSIGSDISYGPKNVFDIEFGIDGNNNEHNENNISIQSDKKYIDRCFFDDDNNTNI